MLSVSNDHAYRTALDWHESGREVVAIVDARATSQGELAEQARALGIRIINQSAVIEAKGSYRVTAARIARVDLDAFRVLGHEETLSCDTIASSGGYSPVVHLSSHTGTRPVWRDDVLGFVTLLLQHVATQR